MHISKEVIVPNIPEQDVWDRWLKTKWSQHIFTVKPNVHYLYDTFEFNLSLSSVDFDGLSWCVFFYLEKGNKMYMYI